MYYLQRRYDIPAYQADSEAGNAVAYARRAIADSSAGLQFYPETHSYYYGDKQIPCVSDILKYFAPFNTLGAAEGVSKNPNHELYGLPVEKIIEIWDEKKNRAADNGTKVHEFGEACYHFILNEDEQISDEFKDRLQPEGLLAVSPKEEAVAKWWAGLDLTRFVPVAKETRIFNPILQYAGTFDILFYDLQEHKYVLFDYKTNEALIKETKTNGKKPPKSKMMIPPLACIPADNIGKYTLQQNLYEIQLRNIGIDVCNRVLIWVKETGCQEVPLPNNEPIIRFAMQERLKPKDNA